MKIFNLFVISLISIVFFTVSISAQTEKKLDDTSSKIASINLKVFEDEKTGIRDLVTAYKQLEIEVEPQLNELKVEAAKLQDIVKSFETGEHPYEPVKDTETFEQKIKILKQEAEVKYKEYQKLSLEFKVKQAIYKLLVDKRYSEIITPINNKIGDALKQFAKEKGYALILDVTSLSCDCIYEDDTPDVTAEFIKFYNDYSEKQKAQ